MDFKIKSSKIHPTTPQLPYVKSIILFGSRAKQSDSDRSDIDLAIVCEKNINNKEWQAILDIIENAETLLSIDCIRYDTLTADSSLRQAIDKEGVFLYQASQNESHP